MNKTAFYFLLLVFIAQTIECKNNTFFEILNLRPFKCDAIYFFCCEINNMAVIGFIFYLCEILMSVKNRNCNSDV